VRASVKAYYKILLIFVVIGIAFFAVSCSIDIKYADPKVAAISIYSLSKVDGYVAGDELDISNAKILVTYDKTSLCSAINDFNPLIVFRLSHI